MNKTEFDEGVKYLREKEHFSFDDAVLLMKLLRSPYGCPWDREQTHTSIRANLIEETYELVEGIDLDSTSLMREESGDVLQQIIFHSEISSGEGRYDIGDVLDELCIKLITRHPHIFSDTVADDTTTVLKNWEKIKSETKGRRTIGDKMNSVSKALPALMRANDIGKQSKKANFDFNSPADAAKKVTEELDEVMAANGGEVADEIGDLLFSVVNLARSLGVEPEEALSRSTDKFVSRFVELEQESLSRGKQVAEMTPEEADEIWEEIKKKSPKTVENRKKQ